MTTTPKLLVSSFEGAGCLAICSHVCKGGSGVVAQPSVPAAVVLSNAQSVGTRVSPV